MEIGCCVNMLADQSDPTGRGFLPLLARLGYDYAELPLAQVMELSDGDFDKLLENLKVSGIPCRCCNNFFPASVRITGPEAHPAEIEKYAKKAVSRAAQLGAKIIVFGSAGAKNVPDGFPMQKAFSQVADALCLIAPRCAEKGVTIAIEPLCRKESNIILNLRDGAALAEAVSHPSVRLLTDYYHFCEEEESIDTLNKILPLLVHAHFARPQRRRVPVRSEPEYEKFFTALKAGGYAGRMSVEAFSDEAENDLAAALSWMREI